MELLPDHHADPAGDGVIEVADIQAGGLLKLVQTIGQGVAVDEEPAGGLGQAQIVGKEGVDGPESVGIQLAQVISPEMLQQVATAGGLGESVDETGQAERAGLIDLLLRIEGVADGEACQKIPVEGRQVGHGPGLVGIGYLDGDHSLRGHGIEQGGHHRGNIGESVLYNQEDRFSSYWKGRDPAAGKDRRQDPPGLIGRPIGEGDQDQGPRGIGPDVVAGKA